MSRIDDLISEMCPKGVPSRTIGSVADVLSGATPAKSEVAYWSGGSIPWLNSGEVNKGTIYEADTRISQVGYDSCSTKMVPPGTVVMALAGQGKTRGMAARTRLECCTNQSLASIIPSAELDGDYLYHFLRAQYLRLRSLSSGDGTRGGLNLAMIRSFEVPVPPLQIQREIASLLDRMEQLQAELQARLQAEMQARSRQYEFYRGQLLTAGGAGASWSTLGEIATNLDARRRPVTKGAREPGPYPYYGASGIVDYVSDYIFDGDLLLVSEDGANLLARSTPIAFTASGKTWINNHAHVLEFRDSLSRRFVEFYLNSIDLSQFISGAAQPKLNKANLNRIPIPVPAKDETERIVTVLDRFDALVNDLSVGLTAETASRRQQYEYYRDKLLTFPERSDAA